MDFTAVVRLFDIFFNGDFFFSKNTLASIMMMMLLIFIFGLHLHLQFACFDGEYNTNEIINDWIQRYGNPLICEYMNWIFITTD